MNPSSLIAKIGATEMPAESKEPIAQVYSSSPDGSVHLKWAFVCVCEVRQYMAKCFLLFVFLDRRLSLVL
jgi:hypothetical protein